MVQPSPSGFGQIDREELGDEHIIVCSSWSTCEVVILQLDDVVGFSVIFGDVVRRSKALQKMSIAHSANEYLRTRPFRTEATSFAIIMAPTMWVLRTLLGLHTVIPGVMSPVRLRFQPGTRSAQAVTGQKAFWWGSHSASRAPWVSLCPMSLGSVGSRIGALNRCSKEMSACCAAAAPRMLFSCWYTSPTSSVEGSGSAATAATF
jgi:hypothetical protein